MNGHHGNKYLRELAMTRKCEFDVGNFTEKRKLATEIVTIIKQLQPPGRFLTLAKKPSTKSDAEDDTGWEEVGLDKAIMKACQVMRDIDRPDRKYRIDRKLARLNRLQALNLVLPHNNVINGDNDTNKNDFGDDNRQKGVVVPDDDTLQKANQPGQLEQHQHDIGTDSNNNNINAIISDVVDNIELPTDQALATV